MLKRFKTEKERGKKRTEETRALWSNLCRAHALKRNEKKLLKQAARDLDYSHPALIFFLRTSFTKLLKEKRKHYSPKEREQLKQLGRILFMENTSSEEANQAIGDDGLPHRFAPDELASLSS